MFSHRLCSVYHRDHHDDNVIIMLPTYTNLTTHNISRVCWVIALLRAYESYLYFVFFAHDKDILVQLRFTVYWVIKHQSNDDMSEWKQNIGLFLEQPCLSKEQQILCVSLLLQFKRDTQIDSSFCLRNDYWTIKKIGSWIKWSRDLLQLGQRVMTSQ